MNLQFVREIPICIVIEASSERRGFLFYLAAGFHKELDPLSGMSANLLLVDKWLENLKKDLQQNPFKTANVENSQSLAAKILLMDSDKGSTMNHAFAEIMAVVRLYLVEEAEKENTVLKSLRFREQRGWTFSWNSTQSPEEMLFSNDFYIECFNPNGSFDLVKVTFNWSRQTNCEADYFKESLKLLKMCQINTSAGLLQGLLKSFVGIRLSTGSFLASVNMNYLAENFTVSF
ncbi:MAG: hypothetical protein ACXVCA_18390 [Bdellovibrio sp.]